MEEGGFHLHKWHSNLPELEECQRTEDNAMSSQASTTYAKLEVGTSPKEQKYWEFHGIKQKTNFLLSS